MVPICMARGLADGRHQELLAEAERRRLIAAVPAGPGTVRRFRPAGGRLGAAGGGGPAAGRPRVAGIRAAGDLIGAR
jgi:hypothetical protein